MKLTDSDSDLSSGATLDIRDLTEDFLTANVCSTTTRLSGEERENDNYDIAAQQPQQLLTVITRYGPDLSCQPLSCGTPTSSQHAEVRPECTSFRCQATITCMAGYKAEWSTLIGPDPSRYSPLIGGTLLL